LQAAGVEHHASGTVPCHDRQAAERGVCRVGSGLAVGGVLGAALKASRGTTSA